MAQLSHREFRPIAAPLTDLSFVAVVKVGRKKHVNCWHVPKTDDYGEACAMGRQYAAELMQHLKDNPGWAGMNVLGREIVPDITAHDKDTDAMSGYAVGFWSSLEVLLSHAVMRENHWAVLQARQDRYDAINATRDIERNNL